MRRRWPALLGGLLTVAMIAGLARQLFGAGLAGLESAVPESPLFYLLFAALYMSPPAFDYVIFRRLWLIPAAGFAALIRKRIANEVVLSYSGEAYFYAWARARTRMVAAPFAAVKDVSILSAIAGNAMTLAMVAAALPLGVRLLSPAQIQGVLGSGAVVIAMSLPFLIFSRRVFSLERKTLWWVFGVHCVRLACGSLLIALAWAAALPAVPFAMWLFLAAGRMLVSRLPLVPNKDLVFANAAILLIGPHHPLADLIAFTAALTLVTHVALIALFGATALAARRG